MALGFIFGEGQQYRTPADLAKARAAANSLLAGQAPTDIGSGLNAIGRAILYRSLMADASAAGARGRTSADTTMNPVAAALGGAFPPPPGGSSKVAGALSDMSALRLDNPNLPSRLDFARADTTRTADTTAGLPDMPTMESYIRRSAEQRGIDPDVAIRVARSEGLQRGTWQSNVTRNGVREPSYGPFQLLAGGKGTGFPEGVGNRFVDATGLDPADPANWRQSIDFALDTAGKHGWRQWHGSRAVGIAPFQGIGPPRPAGSAHDNLPTQGTQGGQFDPSRLPATAGGTADTFDAPKDPTLQMPFNAAKFFDENQAVNAPLPQRPGDAVDYRDYFRSR
nr:MAG TPA: lysozyme [Caudoviricetes sp.]DAK00528.1 MAG TPA: lysozyme [Caudoviricetes sp.]